MARRVTACGSTQHVPSMKRDISTVIKRPPIRGAAAFCPGEKKKKNILTLMLQDDLSVQTPTLTLVDAPQELTFRVNQLRFEPRVGT